MSSHPEDFAPFLDVLTRGGVAALPTESFFGLLADAGRAAAIETLVSLKPRGADKGMPLVLSSRDDWGALVGEIPTGAVALADTFWPGGLSIALRAAPSVDPRLLLDGRIAVRLPGASAARELTRLYGRPLTATSANLPGEPPATTPRAVELSFPRALENGMLAVWRDVSPGGLPSTMVVFDDGRAWIARDGAVARERVAAVLGKAGVSLDGREAHR
jgi:tRNA threonylcarbamoyl adenosine modification protein (Sua5/YciO/YrdC/YwlC family)